MPPSEILLWHEDYFELKVHEKQQIKEECFDLPFPF